VRDQLPMTRRTKYSIAVGAVVASLVILSIALRLLLYPPFPNVLSAHTVVAGVARWEDEISLVELSINEVAKHLRDRPELWHPVQDRRAALSERSVYRPSDHAAVITLRRDDGVTVICRLERQSDNSLEIVLMYPK